MSTASLQFRMPKLVSRKVRRLRWLVRTYVLLDGVAAIALVLGLAFWLGLAIDWMFEPATWVRAGMWGLAVSAAVFAAIRYLLGPITKRLSKTNIALLLERNFPELNQSVITTVEAADRRRKVPVGNYELLQNTSDKAAASLRSLRLWRIFQFGPLLWKTSIATALILSIFAFANLRAEAFNFWIARMRLSTQPWPRLVELSIVGFQEINGQQVVNVARDDDYELQVQASIRDGHQTPEQVEIRYRLANGSRGRATMTRIGEAIPGRDDAQLYRFEFKKVASDINFDLIGGDDRLRNLQLRVVERPQMFPPSLDCEYPDYLQRAPLTIPVVSGRAELPEGTQAVCRVETNKPLVEVTVRDPAMQIDLPVQLDEASDQKFAFPVAVEQKDRVLLVTMRDQDGVENREPYRIVLSTIIDQPPEVSVQLKDIGSAVTRQAKLPLAGQVTDEYGLQEVWFSYQIDTGQADASESNKSQTLPGKRLTSNPPAGDLKLTELGNFDLALSNPETKRPQVEIQPGQRITLSVKASDAYNLQQSENSVQNSHVGSSQRFTLDVVTNSELRALLEKKELALRQRFESIYEKMVGSRELLDRIQLNQSETTTKTAASGVARSLERDRLRLNGVLQNVVQLSYETLGVADGFESIVGELVNNRVNTEELTQRLMQGIAEPLRDIGNQLMPQLEEDLQKLQAAINQQQPTRKLLTAAQVQGDEVLDAMKQVLDRMLELESYNELVELLREITAEQQQLQEETKKKRRDKLRSLLED